MIYVQPVFSIFLFSLNNVMFYIAVRSIDVDPLFTYITRYVLVEPIEYPVDSIIRRPETLVRKITGFVVF